MKSIKKEFKQWKNTSKSYYIWKSHFLITQKAIMYTEHACSFIEKIR